MGAGPCCGIRSPWVRFDDDRLLQLVPRTFTYTSAGLTLTRLQLPLRLGWALTVHRAQGATLTRAELQLDGAFDFGQVYVALSRVESLAGLWIRGQPITQRLVKAHPKVIEFYGLA